MAKRPTNEMIHCDVCGEDYSATYKRCPFCEEEEYERRRHSRDSQYEEDYADDEYEEDEYEERPARRPRQGWRRLTTPRRGGGYGGGPPIRKIVSIVLEVALIAAAIVIVIGIIRPLVDRGDVDPDLDGTTTPPVTDPAETPSTDPDGETTDDPEATPSPETPDGQTATSFTLNYTEFAISDQYPDPVTLRATFSPAGSTGTITWSSSNPGAVTVDENGTVTAVGRGTATITAALADGYTQTCTVYSTISGTSTGSGSGSGTGTSTGGLTLSRSDFTLNTTWPTYTFTVTGASGTVTWSSSNTAVATVDANGTVTRQGTGSCTVTATDSAGNTATCIVRCS